MLTKINLPKVNPTKTSSSLVTSKVNLPNQKSTHFTKTSSNTKTTKVSVAHQKSTPLTKMNLFKVNVTKPDSNFQTSQVNLSNQKSTHFAKTSSNTKTTKVSVAHQKSTPLTKNTSGLKTSKSNFSTNNKGFGIKEKFFKMTEQLMFASNPKIGKQVLKLETRGIFIRVDGREPLIFQQDGGLKPRANKEQILNLTFDDIINYQRFNQNPFGWGACRSFLELAKFIANNQSHADSRWIIAFYGSGTSLLDLKFHTGIESDGYDMEAEQLVFNHVPFTHFLVASCPNFRPKFMDDLLVPNLMHDFNPSLPKTVRKSDLCSDKQLLSWLLKHNCEEAFTSVCAHLYRDKSEFTLKMMLEGGTYLVEAVQSALRISGQTMKI
ncbi:hypothetical protein [Legionella waltersii]|uniref:Dot/Icm T4SS effector n=2 Tax=Legionella waltersii TaxID=66969 RepID=A0A0W1A4R6_9GAMM|nr:hypothetical protein [Legionella waltersii]KTD76331.1 Dot/Icm T4SS effector [Legionella waltersii]